MSGAAADGIDDRDVPKLELLNAAFIGDIQGIDKLMKEKKVHIDSADDDDVTALHIAAAMGNNKLVLYLLDHGANIDACNQLGMTAYHYAAREGQLAVIDTLLQRGANVQKKTSLGVTALTLACAGGHADVVRRLLSFRDMSQSSETPKRTLAPTSLIVATCSKSPQICHYLVRSGFKVDETIETLGLSAMSVAIMCTPGVFMVRSLLDLKASVTKGLILKQEKTDSTEARRPHRIIPEELARLMKRKDLENLFADNSRVQSKRPAGSDVWKEIKEDRIINRDLGPPSKNGCTHLMYAMIVRSINSAKYLISHKEMDVHAMDDMDITALQVACLLRVDELIPSLLQKNVDVCAVNKYGLTAYDLFLTSSDVMEPNPIRSQLHCYRPVDMKLNLSSSSSNFSFQTKNLLTKVVGNIGISPTNPGGISPSQWLEAKTKYQPSKNRNAYKFASVEDILKGTKIAKPPVSNECDMEIEAMREMMEENQSFAVTCFTDFYGERDKTTTSEYYDVAQFHAKMSGYHRKEEADEVRRLPTFRPRKSSLEREPRKPRSISMMDSPNQMRTTPRMLKKSRDPGTEYYSAQAGRARANGMQVPTVVVSRPRPVVDRASITIDAIWNMFIRRGRQQLMEELKKDEIDKHSFFMLGETMLREMGIYTPEKLRVIQEIQAAILRGSL